MSVTLLPAAAGILHDRNRLRAPTSATSQANGEEQNNHIIRSDLPGTPDKVGGEQGGAGERTA